MSTSPGRNMLPLAVGVALFLLAASARPFAADIATPQTVLSVTPDKLDFGSVPVDTRTQPQTVTLTNQGHTPVSIASILVSGIDFAQTNTCGDTLAPGAQCSIKVTFQPAITGPRLGTAIISTSDDPASPHLLILNGVGEGQ
jgi:HYDIN/CFA65/VesB-like, Ig-like domain